jgi:mevalonate kinase
MPYGHGKVILFGEHSVVYGHPALALAVPRGAEVRGQLAPAGDPTSLHIEPWNVDIDTRTAPSSADARREPLQRALRVARDFYDDQVEVALHAEMRLPGGAGMGSSAALGVAVLRALDEARGLSRPEAELFERSLAWERVFHGNPSGVDNAMATYGGVAVFTKGAPLQRIVGRGCCKLRLLAGDSGNRPAAKDMVESVAHQRVHARERVDKVFEAIAAVVVNGKSEIERCDLKRLGQLMTLNHKLLCGLMLSTDEIEKMNEAAMNAGALGAKVTGAGGGGCMIALVDDDEAHAAVKAALVALGKRVYEVEIDI